MEIFSCRNENQPTQFSVVINFMGIAVIVAKALSQLLLFICLLNAWNIFISWPFPSECIIYYEPYGKPWAMHIIFIRIDFYLAKLNWLMRVNCLRFVQFEQWFLSEFISIEWDKSEKKAHSTNLHLHSIFKLADKCKYSTGTVCKRCGISKSNCFIFFYLGNLFYVFL